VGTIACLPLSILDKEAEFGVAGVILTAKLRQGREQGLKRLTLCDLLLTNLLDCVHGAI